MLALAFAAVVTLTVPAAIRPGMPGYPRIARPADVAQHRINAALTQMEATTRRSARECLDGEGKNPTDWQRRVRVTMRGPGFLSYAVEDEVDCGGAHPDEEHGAIVYDLASGAPVDWTTLLPPRLYGTLTLNRGSDGVRLVTLTSARLTALYRERYRSGQDPEVDEGCRAAIGMQDGNEGETERGSEPIAMFAWLDARRGGLVLQFDLSHAIQACSSPVLIPTDTLRREGAAPRLIAALDTAHRLALRQSRDAHR